MSRGLVFDIARGSVADGPGLRTTVFLKGCPLRCRWCHNPESWSSGPCACSDFASAAERDRYRGFEIDVAGLETIVLRDAIYFSRSGGGLTLSGGEPTMQAEFCLEVLASMRAKGIGTCIETSGYCDRGLLLELARSADLWLFDIKATGTRLHEELTGVGDQMILGNLDALYGAGAAIVLRCPLVPKVNDAPGHLEHIARLARAYPRGRVELLPYHDLGRSKFDKSGIPRTRLDTFVPDAAYVAGWKAALADLGVESSIA